MERDREKARYSRHKYTDRQRDRERDRETERKRDIADTNTLIDREIERERQRDGEKARYSRHK